VAENGKTMSFYVLMLDHNRKEICPNLHAVNQ
jgi:hypothetical protein